MHKTSWSILKCSDVFLLESVWHNIEMKFWWLPFLNCTCSQSYEYARTHQYVKTVDALFSVSLSLLSTVTQTKRHTHKHRHKITFEICLITDRILKCCFTCLIYWFAVHLWFKWVVWTSISMECGNFWRRWVVYSIAANLTLALYPAERGSC